MLKRIMQFVLVMVISVFVFGCNFSFQGQLQPTSSTVEKSPEPESLGYDNRFKTEGLRMNTDNPRYPADLLMDAADATPGIAYTCVDGGDDCEGTSALIIYAYDRDLEVFFHNIDVAAGNIKLAEGLQVAQNQ